MPAVLAPPAATVVTRADPGCDHVPTASTLGSVWHEVAGIMIGDELLEWPPDMLALTEVILQRSEAYRFALPRAPAQPGRLPGFLMPHRTCTDAGLVIPLCTSEQACIAQRR